SFLVEEMMGHYGPVGGNAPRKTGVQRAQNDLAAWENLVDEYASGTHAGYSIDWDRQTTVDVNSAYFGLGDDDGFHTDTNDSIHAIAFIYPGGMFRIQRSCGNLVGDAAPPVPPTPPAWGKMVGTSVAKDSSGTVLSNGSSTGSIAAGETIYWTHTVEDNRTVGTDTTPTITGDIIWGGNTSLSGTTESNNTYSRSFTGNNDPVTRSRSRGTSTADINNIYCQHINGNHTSSNDSTSFRSADACVRVVTPANITPHTSLTPNPIGVGQGYTAKAWYTNGGGIAGAATGTWRTWLDNGDQTYGAGDTNVSGPSTSTYTVSTSGTTAAGAAVTGTADGSHAYVCTELYNVTAAAPGTVTGDPSLTCAAIVSRPYFSVLGGDVAAGAGFGTNGVAGAGIIGTNNDGSPNFNGASAQLAALALGNITSFTTSQSPNGGVGPAWTNSLGGGYSPSALGFANTIPPVGASTYGGSFAGLKVQDYYGTTLNGTTQPSSTIDVASLASGNYSHSGDLTLTASTIPASGQKIVLKVSGDVYIAGPITYGAAGALTDIQQFELIVSGNIYVAPTVAELDGFYAAQGNGTSTGKFVSCGTNSTSPWSPLYGGGNIAICHQQLVVNGAVAAQKVILNRTYGDINGSGASLPQQPGEVIRFSPMLWAPSAIGHSGVNGWQSVTSLPPIL
ncbi:MAG TPA: hypothetical protein VN031_03995, partial [Candidatus Microsaccharimonas sp.]|nr:hypothetical protein [Candidatus Microsaccharimonas sp.]